jgi:hypothetical protein
MSSLAIFPPSPSDAANDFLSVAPATFPPVAFRVRGDFLSSNHCARLQAASSRLKGGVSVMAQNYPKEPEKSGRSIACDALIFALLSGVVAPLLRPPPCFTRRAASCG